MIFYDKNTKSFSPSGNLMPKITILPPIKRTDRVGTRSTLRCHVQGAEPLKVWWSRADGSVLPEIRARVFKKGQETILRISRLSVRDGVKYTCSARNNFGFTSKEAEIVVLGMLNISFVLEKVSYHWVSTR